MSAIERRSAGVHTTQDGGTVILLHSSAGSARQWDALVDLLAPSFRVHAIEVHGHGRQSDWLGARPLMLADEVAVAAPLLRSGAVHVIGHSYGAAVALKLATLHPQAVASLVAYEPVPFRWLSDDPIGAPALQEVVVVADGMRTALAQDDPQAAGRRFIDFWSGIGAWDAMPAGRRDLLAARMPAVLGHFDALFAEPMQPQELAGLRMPMLFISGARTRAVTRRLAERLRAAATNAEHLVLPFMGHMGPITHASEVNQEIVQFLRLHASFSAAVQTEAIAA